MIILGLLFALLVAVFVICNAKTVTVGFIVWSADIPLGVLIILCVLIGAFLMYVISLIKTLKISSLKKEVEKEKDNLALELESIKTQLEQAKGELEAIKTIPVVTEEPQPVEVVTEEVPAPCDVAEIPAEKENE